MSEPRGNGVSTNTFDSQCLAPSSSYPGEMCLSWGTTCSTVGRAAGIAPTGAFMTRRAGTGGPVQATCPGGGELEGLTYVWFHMLGGATDPGDGTSYHGFIDEGPPPGEPWPLPSE